MCVCECSGCLQVLQGWVPTAVTSLANQATNQLPCFWQKCVAYFILGGIGVVVVLVGGGGGEGITGSLQLQLL